MSTREELRRNEMFAEALQTRINALSRDYVGRDNPAQRRQIGQDRAEALSELSRVKGGRRARQETDCRHRRRSAKGRRSSRLAALIRSSRVPLPPSSFSSKTRTRSDDAPAGAGARGHAVLEAKDQPEAVKHLQQGQPAVVLSDLRLPDGDGFGVLRASKEIDPDVPVIVMTAYGSIEDAVSAMKEGAMDFLAKPVDPDHLLLLVARALDQRRIVTENLLLKEELAVRRGAPLLVGENASLRKVYSSLQRAATTDTTVLIEGESGTGKELFARSLHALSARADAPFVAINCAAIPENLLETELFGYEKGAFTGAVARKPGKFEIAHRGTLFLDEIGDLPLPLQAKILRALEEKRFERVGGTASVQVDVRLVAATNQGMKAAVAARRFREDLYFRLSVFPITVPPLRERAGDVPLLARHFVDRFCRDLNKKPLVLSPEAVEQLQSYYWPGTCASCRTASSARSFSPMATRSCRGTSTCPSSRRRPPRSRPVRGNRSI